MNQLCTDICTDILHLMTWIRSDKCFIRRFLRCANMYLHKYRLYSLPHN